MIDPDDTAGRGTCALCGASIPVDLLAAHLCEHDPDLSQQIADAPVIDQTGEEPA